MFGISTASVRPSSVRLRPMDRVTATRNVIHVPNRIAHMAIGGARVVRVNSIDTVGDYIILRIWRAGSLRAKASRSLQRLQHRRGVTATSAKLVQWAAEKARLHADHHAQDADIIRDPNLRDGMWGATTSHESASRRAGSARDSRRPARLHGLDQSRAPHVNGIEISPRSGRLRRGSAAGALAGQRQRSRFPSCSTTRKAASTAYCTATPIRSTY